MKKVSKQLPWKLFGFWSFVAVVLIYFLVIEEGISLNLGSSLSLLFGLAPLIGAQLTLGSPKAAENTRNWLRKMSDPLKHTAAGFAVLFLISGLIIGKFNPYSILIFTLGSYAALGTLRQIEKGKSGLTWADGAVWLLLWIPFDLRWNYELWNGVDGFAYNWWAIAVSVIAVIGWYGLRELPGFTYNLVPTWKDIKIAISATLVFAVIIIPIGLAIEFVSFPPSTPFDFVAFIATTIGLFLTVAIPEELFFRGILLHGFDQMKMNARPWLPLLMSSLLFGIMHWNNESDLTSQIAYVALATVAGLFLGWTYRKSGNKLLAPVIMHTLVDLIWRYLFQ